MTRTALQRLILALLLALPAGCRQQAQEVKEEKPPEFATVRVGFAERYKVGLWTPLEVTLRGGSSRIERCRVRANLPDSDGLNCSFEAPDCQLLPEQEMKVVLYVRFGRESGPLGLQLLEGDKTLAEKTFNSNSSPPEDRFHDALTGPGKHGGGQRLIVSVGKSPLELEKAAAEEEDQETHQPKEPRNVVAKVDGLAGLPTRWEGYEGVDVVIVSTSDPESLFAKITPENARVEALEQWVRMGGKLVLCAGSKAEEVLHATSPLAKFLPGRFDKSVLLRQTSGWESYAKSTNPIPPPKTGEKVEMPTPRLADVQGKIEAREGDLPLVIRKPQGLGQVIFVAADLDRGPIRDWSDRRSLLAAILDLPANGQAGETDNFGPNYGYNDLAGQLRSALDVPRDVHLVPFFVVALLVVVYILLIGPGDYFLLRRLGLGMQWTWITFPAIVVLFAAGAYLAAYWLKGNQLRVSQIDLVDIDTEGMARGASWFSIYSPRGESFDLSMQPRLPDGKPPQEANVSLAWFGKAGDEFNGMYSRDRQNSSPPWSEGYSIAPSLEAIRGVPIQVWASKCFAQRWMGRAADLGLDVELKDDGRQLSGTITNRLKAGAPQVKEGPALSGAFLAYGDWAYVLGELRPGRPVEIGATTQRISLSTYMGDETHNLAEGPAAGTETKWQKTPYDNGSRDMAYVLETMMFYDAAGGWKRAHMANDYQGFTDLSGLLKAGRAILVAMPPQDGTASGGDLLRGPLPKADEPDQRRPLGNALDRHAVIYRFVLPVTQASPDN